jgi:hypothetical protein
MFHHQYLCRAAANQQGDRDSTDFSCRLLQCRHTLRNLGRLFVTALA